jgi:hypothetical protein
MTRPAEYIDRAELARIFRTVARSVAIGHNDRADADDVACGIESALSYIAYEIEAPLKKSATFTPITIRDRDVTCQESEITDRLKDLVKPRDRRP